MEVSRNPKHTHFKYWFQNIHFLCTFFSRSALRGKLSPSPMTPAASELVKMMGFPNFFDENIRVGRGVGSPHTSSGNQFVLWEAVSIAWEELFLKWGLLHLMRLFEKGWKGEKTLSIDSKLSMKAPNAIKNSPGAFLHALNCQGHTNQHITINIRDLTWKHKKGRNHGKGEVLLFEWVTSRKLECYLWLQVR